MMPYISTVCSLDVSVHSDELKAFQEAIKDPEIRKEIISILEEAGLLRGLHRQLA